MLFCRNISYPYGDSNTVVVVLYFDDIGNISYPDGDSNLVVVCHYLLHAVETFHTPMGTATP